MSSFSGLSSRYYLKNITVSQTLFPDDIVNELIRESAVCFLQLNSVELAIQLTLEDYTIFRQIEPTEYIDYLFNLKSNYGTPALSQFAEVCISISISGVSLGWFSFFFFVVCVRGKHCYSPGGFYIYKIALLYY